MTVNDLKYEYQKRHPEGHFFDKDTLKFFGERPGEMRVLRGTEKIRDSSGNVHECLVLSSIQHACPGGARHYLHYFDVETFNVVSSADRRGI